MAHSPMGGRPVDLPVVKKQAMKAAPKAKPVMDHDSDMDMDQDQDQQQPQDITSDEHAMSLVDELKSMGYTAEDVASAFDSEDEQSTPNTTGPSSAKSAPSMGVGQNIKLPPMMGR